jgi:hypothetical protein
LVVPASFGKKRPEVQILLPRPILLLACGLTVGRLPVKEKGEGSTPSVPANFDGAVRLVHRRYPYGVASRRSLGTVQADDTPRALTDTNEASLHAYHLRVVMTESQRTRFATFVRSSLAGEGDTRLGGRKPPKAPRWGAVINSSTF